MLPNHLYNLVHQLIQEHKSLWRIKNHYLQDSQGCEKCQEFWKKLEEDKESHISELLELIREHLEKES